MIPREPKRASQSAIDRVLRWIALVLQSYVVIGGALSLLGWVLDAPRLAGWDDDGISTQPNSALAATSIGVALLFLTWKKPRYAAWFGAFAALIGASVVIQSATGRDLGIDTLLMFDRTWGRVGVRVPGRMGPPGATSWTMLGLAVVCAARPTGSLARSFAVALSLVPAAVATLSLVGYLYGVSELYMLPRVTVIALQTSSFIFAASLSVMMSIPERAPMQLVRDPGPAGLLTRWTVPVIVAVPVLLGYIRLRGQQLGLYDTSFGTAARTLSEITCLLALFALTAHAIRRHSERVAQAEEALRETQTRLVDTLESITDGFVTLDADWRFTYANSEAERLLGKKRADLIGKRTSEVFPEAIDTAAAAEMRRAKSERVSTGFEAFHPLLQRWFSNKAYPIDGGGLALYFQDITARKQNEAALLAKDVQLQHIADNAEVLVSQCNRRFEYVFVNRACADFLGQPADQIIGRSIPDVVGEAAFAAIRPHLERVLAGERVEYEAEIPYAKLGRRWVRIVYVPDRDPSGGVCGWIAAITDLTQRKAIEIERETLLERECAARADAERNARLKDEFLATLSHELRTPLNAVIGWSQLLRQDLQDPVRARHAVDVIERNARSQAQLIADLLDMSSITSGKMRLDVQVVDPHDVVRSAIESIAPAADARGVGVHTALAPVFEIVHGDPARLRQVVWNLLSNAVKFTPRGGRVDVSVAATNGSLEIKVADTGEGLSPEFLPHVFDRFRQADASPSRRHGGLGIGLALVKQFVELHGGSVSASSHGVGKGATFVIQLPIARREPLILPAPSAPARAFPRTHLKNLRVLVVDDDRDSLTMLRRILEEHGAAVELAVSADEGLQLLRDRTFDVMVSDIGMPIRDGYDLITDARSRGVRVPALALTAFAGAEDKKRAFRAGYQGHLAKPVDAAEFLVAVATLAGRNSS